MGKWGRNYQNLVHVGLILRLLMRFLLQKLVRRAKKSTVPRLVVSRGLWWGFYSKNWYIGQKWEFCGKWDFRDVNFVKNEVSEMWTLWKMRFQECEFCDKWGFRNVNFVKIGIFNMWFLWKMDLWNVIFVKNTTLKICDFQIVNFAKNAILKMWIFR